MFHAKQVFLFFRAWPDRRWSLSLGGGVMPAFKGRQQSCSPEGATAQKYPRKKPPSATWGVEPLRISCSEALYDSTLDSEIECDAYHFLVLDTSATNQAG
jgi:hypothetical protein